MILALRFAALLLLATFGFSACAGELARPLQTVARNEPRAPLALAQVEPYMDALEADLRAHARHTMIARQGNAIDLVIANGPLFYGDDKVDNDVLEPVAGVLRRYSHTSVEVNGYTDTMGTAEHNLAVSRKRARAVADALVEDGVAAGRLTAAGLGGTHLRVMTGDGRRDRRNRRIEIILKARPES